MAHGNSPFAEDGRIVHLWVRAWAHSIRGRRAHSFPAELKQARPPALKGGSFEENGRPLRKMNHEWTRMNTNRPEDRWTSFNDKRRQDASGNLVAPGVTMSWDEGFPGARASRPHKTWHSLGHLPRLDRPGTAPWLSCGLADAVPARRVAACSIALKLSGGQRDRMRAGRPRSQAMPSQQCGGGCLAGDFSFGFK